VQQNTAVALLDTNKNNKCHKSKQKLKLKINLQRNIKKCSRKKSEIYKGAENR